MFPLNALNYLAPSILITKVSLVWYCSQFAMQNIVLLMLTLVNMEGQTTVGSWEVLVYTKRLRKTNSMCQLHGKLKGLKIHCPTFFLGTRFSARTWLMRHFPGSLDHLQKIFNYWLSRAGRKIENAFGMLVLRWRIFKRPIRASIETALSIIGAFVCLHCYLQTTQSTFYTVQSFIGVEGFDGANKEGNWRNIIKHDSALNSFTKVK